MLQLLITTREARKRQNVFLAKTEMSVARNVNSVTADACWLVSTDTDSDEHKTCYLRKNMDMNMARTLKKKYKYKYIVITLA